MQTLKDLFLSELADIYDAERQIIKALPKIAKASTCTELKKLILAHFNETEENLKKLEQVFQSFGEKTKRQTCKATEGLLLEFGEIAANFKGSPAINAAMVSVTQKVDHYEVASLGCLHEWADLLGNKEAATLLQEILNVEKQRINP